MFNKTISLETYKVPLVDIAELVLGRKVYADKNTGELVLSVSNEPKQSNQAAYPGLNRQPLREGVATAADQWFSP